MQASLAGDLWVIHGAGFKEHVNPDSRRVIKQERSNEKPAGERKRYAILCDGATIELRVNGILQNRATECTLTQGYIALQSEGAPIESPNLRLTLHKE